MTGIYQCVTQKVTPLLFEVSVGLFTYASGRKAKGSNVGGDTFA